MRKELFGALLLRVLNELLGRAFLHHHAAISTSSHSRLLREKTRLHSRMGMQPPDIGVLQVGRAAAADKFLHRGVRQQDAMVQQ